MQVDELASQDDALVVEKDGKSSESVWASSSSDQMKIFARRKSNSQTQKKLKSKNQMLMLRKHQQIKEELLKDIMKHWKWNEN